MMLHLGYLYQGQLDVAGMEPQQAPLQNLLLLEVPDHNWNLEILGSQTQLHYPDFQVHNPARKSEIIK